MTLDSQRTLEALEAMTDPVSFEMLCAEVLSSHSQYTGLVPQGVGRRDGGKDAIRRILVTRREQTVDGQGVSWLTEGQVFHFSLRRDVETKVKQDLENTRTHGLNPSLVVFVTNRRCTPELQDKLKVFCQDEYDLPLEILDQHWLRLPLDGEWQSVRKRYLHIDYDFTVFHNLDRLLQERRRHPNLRDLESGTYYRRARLHAALAASLEQHRVALVLGPPGHGKTALAMAYGWEWRREDPRREVFYLSARKEREWQDWEKAVHAFDQPHALYIIDDAHLNVETVTQFSSARHDFHQARIMLISRPLDPSLRGGEEDSYFERLTDHVVEVASQAEEWGEIVRALFRHPEVEAEHVGDPQRLLERCQGDLHLLRHLFNAWLSLLAPRPELAAVPEAAVDADVVARYVHDERDSENALLVLAAFGQYEIPLETAWLSRRPAFQTAVLREHWADLSHIDCYGQPREFAEFFHSTPARLLLHAFHRLGRLGRSVEAHTLDCMRNYLETLPGNAVEMLFALYRNGQEEMERKMLTPALARRVLESLPSDRWDGLADAGRLLFALWRIENSPTEGGSARDLCAMLKDRCMSGLPAFSEPLGLSQAWWFLFSVSKLDPDYHRQLLMGLDYPALGRCSRGEGTATVVTLLNAASRAGVNNEKLLAFYVGLDFTNLGRRSHDVGFTTIKNYLDTLSRAGVGNSELRAYCAGLNFGDLGRRASKACLLTVQLFLNAVGKIDVDKMALRDFYAEINFADLGARSSLVGLSTLGNFLEFAKKTAVDNSKLQIFCVELDFTDLGLRSRDVGLATVKSFLDITSQIKVEKGKLRDFCEQLNFVFLGASILGAPLSTVWPFMQAVSLIGVSDEKLQAFANQLDWRGLGEKMRPKPDGQRKVSLAELIWAAKNRGISRTHARTFVEGWGWSDICNAVKTHLSPDGLAALFDLLRFRCGYSDSELTAQGIDPSDDKLWLVAFSDHVGGKWEHSKNQARYFVFALRHMDGALRRNHYFWQFLTLRQWSILAHNLELADPARLDKQLWPAMRQVEPKQWAGLIEQTDISNLSYFLAHFGPDGCFHDRSLVLALPKPVALAGKTKQATTLETALLLLNLWWVKGGGTAAGLVGLWRADAQWLPGDFRQADLRSLDFLAWGLLLADPSGDWLIEGAFADAWKRRLEALMGNHEGKVEDWLGVLGLYALSGKAPHWAARVWWFSAQQVEEHLMSSFTKPDSEILRRLAGMAALFPGQLSPTFRQAALAALQTLPVRNQIPIYEQARVTVVSSFTDGVPA